LLSSAHDEIEMSKLAPLAADWETQVRGAFLEAYAAAAGPLGVALRGGAGLLGTFELEKALRELHDEISSRLQWVMVPLQGILEAGGSNAKL
jgi:predicted trehalose synthase